MRNPETTPQDEKFEPRQNDAMDYPTEIAGPGGTTTFIENNEKGILEAVIFRTLGMHQQSPLGSSNNAHRVDVYSQDTKYGD